MALMYHLEATFETLDGIRSDEYAKRPGLHDEAPVEAPEGELADGHAEIDGLALTGCERNATKSLELPHRPRHARHLIMHVELHDGLSCARSGIRHGGGHFEGVVLAESSIGHLEIAVTKCRVRQAEPERPARRNRHADVSRMVLRCVRSDPRSASVFVVVVDRNLADGTRKRDR